MLKETEGVPLKRSLLFLLLAAFLLSLFGCAKPQRYREGGVPADSSTETTADPTVRVTFPEGLTAVEIAEKLEANGVCSAAEFMAAVNDLAAVRESYACLSSLDRPEDRAFALEGYVFPDTYDFYSGESATRALSRFLTNMDRKWTDAMTERAAALGYTPDDILTIASIIQEEAGDPNEMGKVSSVLHNRLNSPDYGKLQCDVTIHYVNDRVTDSPYLTGDTARFAELYNTYKCDGLPAGPICCPGMDAINAALYPEETEYFFFVTDADMNYYYAATWAEHQENCRICGIG